MAGIRSVSVVKRGRPRNGDNRSVGASAPEQRAYAMQVLRDLSLTIDGHRLTPQLVALQFPGTDEMKEGRGEIQIDFSADLPRGGRNRKLVFENNHQSRISAFQVNCLVPRDPAIRISGQHRNYMQSQYQLEYEQNGVPADPSPSWLITIALLRSTLFVLQ